MFLFIIIFVKIPEVDLLKLKPDGFNYFDWNLPTKENGTLQRKIEKNLNEVRPAQICYKIDLLFILKFCSAIHIVSLQSILLRLCIGPIQSCQPCLWVIPCQLTPFRSFFGRPSPILENFCMFVGSLQAIL